MSSLNSERFRSNILDSARRALYIDNIGNLKCVGTEKSPIIPVKFLKLIKVSSAKLENNIF